MSFHDRTLRSREFCRNRPPAHDHQGRDGQRAVSDRDLASIAEARALARHAKQALAELAEFSQERIVAIVDAMAEAATSQAEAFARLAVEETGYGVVEDKVQTNLFASQKVYDFIRPM